MLRRHKRLLVLTLLVMVTTFWWGCTQPDDILTEKSTTLINLAAERLPTTPVGMTYQLWAADTIILDSLYGSVNIGDPFTYDFELNRYYDANGVARPDSNEFRLTGDILSYQWVFIAVQRQDGSGPSPGPVMLIDTVTPDGYSELNMVFPFSDSLWNSAIEFNMETPSDSDRNAADGAGIWFTYYSEREWTYQDTTALTYWVIETLPPQDSLLPNELPCIQNIVEISDPVVVDTFRVLGFDTIRYQIVTYSQETVQTCDEGQGNLFRTNVDSMIYETGPLNTITYDDFYQVAVDLPDLRPMGWYYQGWVVSSVIRDMDAGVGEMTLPAWVGLNRQDTLIRATDGHLLSTGLFWSLEHPDESNKYVYDPTRVPPFPGEDFLKSRPPNHRNLTVNLVTDDNLSTGSVFISVYPINAFTDTTNFPLIIQLRDLPAYPVEVENETQQFIMQGMANHNTFGMNTRVGLPQVQAKVRRF